MLATQMILRRLVLVLTASCALACFSPTYKDGVTPCGAADQCPGDLRCAVDRHCWHAGVEPPACMTGFERQTDGSCKDIDECQRGTAGCDTHAICTNLAGSFTCACSPGFTGDGKTCTDIDECQRGLAGCDSHAACFNTPGSFTCTCNPGYRGDGKTCAQFFTQIATAGDHTCAVRTDGALYCWGTNGRGQLGAPKETSESRVPLRVGTETWSSVAVTRGATCGIKAEGTLWCWGDDACALIGDGGDNIFCDGVRPTFVAFPTGGRATRWKAVTMGQTHACAIQLDGSLWCWGENYAGDLGTNDDVAHTSPTRVGQDLAADKDWDSVTAGDFHTCGLRGGHLWCWGQNKQGQLGDAMAEQFIAFPRPIGTLGTWSAVAAGSAHSCGVTSDQKMWCWGQGFYGQLGNGKSGGNAATSEPALVPGTFQWVDVSAGVDETCGRTTTSAMFCFGANATGQLGDGTFTDRSAPSMVGRTSDWAQVSVGQAVGCAVNTSGQMWCWGENREGAIGVGTGGTLSTPTEVAPAGTFTQIAGSAAHQCGIQSDKSLWCWGRNDAGQLGIGQVGGYRDAPTAVAGGGSWTWVAAGDHSTCGVQAGGLLRCWGQNAFGELGIGSHGGDAGAATPQPVTGLSWTRVSVRQQHACGLQQDGSVWCWGSSAAGRLGLGDPMVLPPTVDVPTRVPGVSWTAVSAGDNHTCGVRAGTLYCWGANPFGQLGTGDQPPNNQPVFAPVAIGTATDWTTVSAGQNHTCGLHGSPASLSCWGYNFFGQLGNGSSGGSANLYSPGPVTSSKPWLDVSAGDTTTCGVGADGSLWCWGGNPGGLVGSGGAGDLVPTPVQISDSKTFVQVALMAQGACALHSGGGTACWGQNLSGELGNDTAFYESPARVTEP
jgi:alpha-tubulin suppressor-like RCC1 family protein